MSCTLHRLITEGVSKHSIVKRAIDLERTVVKFIYGHDWVIEYVWKKCDQDLLMLNAFTESKITTFPSLYTIKLMIFIFVIPLQPSPKSEQPCDSYNGSKLCTKLLVSLRNSFKYFPIISQGVSSFTQWPPLLTSIILSKKMTNGRHIVHYNDFFYGLSYFLPYPSLEHSFHRRLSCDIGCA